MISIVIPNFNSGERLIKNLPKLFGLLKKSKLDFEVLIVDDNSTDDSVLVLENYLELGICDFEIFKKKSNTGFGMTVDKGIRAAKGEIVFVLNATDLLPESAGYFKLMLAHFRNKKVFSVGAAKKENGEIHGCGEIYFEKGSFLHRRGFQKKSSLEKNSSSLISAWADGGAQAIRRDLYLKIGGFDPLYKFYWEDVDLGWRAWKAGYEIHFEPKAVLLHQKSEGPIAKYYSDRERRIMNLRNQFIFTWKNADLKHLCLYFLWELYHALVATKNSDGDFFRAYWQAMLAWPAIFVARARQKKFTRLSDDEVLSKFR